jgi:hypothetical protein
MKATLAARFKSGDTCSVLLHAILELGLYCDGVAEYSHFIKDSLVAKTFVSFLRCDDPQIRETTADFLVTYANPRHIKQYSRLVTRSWFPCRNRPKGAPRHGLC